VLQNTRDIKLPGQTDSSGFRDKRTAAVFLGKAPKGFPSDIADAARRKLRMLDTAKVLADLRTPSGNRLEALRGDRAGQRSR